MDNLEIIINNLDEHMTAIKVDSNNIKYANIFKEYINKGLLLKSKPYLIVTRELLEIIKKYKNI